jgi:hypothetical protein
LIDDAVAKGMEIAGHGAYPGGCYSYRIEDGIRLAVVDGPIERDNFVAHASAFYVPRTHGVDCDCPPCRNRYIESVDEEERTAAVCYHPTYLPAPSTQTAYGWGV